MTKYKSITFKISFLVSVSVILSALILSTVYVITSRQKAFNDILANTLSFAEVSSQPIYNDYLVSTGSRFKSLLFDRMANNKDITQISMIGIDGRVYFNSDTLKAETSQTSDFVDIASVGSEFKFIDDQETLKMVKSEDVSHRTFTTNNQTFEEIIIPVKETDTSHIVSMRYLVSYNSLKERINEIYLQTAIILPLCLIFVIVSILLSRTITKPINELFLAFEQVKIGNYNITLNNKSDNEIGMLSETFNKMVTSLKESQQKQQEYQHVLEQDVSDRTKELAQKISELEALNKVMVGREMKMIELKKEITNLQEQLKQKAV